MVTHPDLAYTFEPKLINGRMSSYVSSTCSNCTMPQQFRWTGPNNPHHVAARFQRLGWDFDPYRASRNLCRECNPHHKDKTVNNQIPLPNNFKTAGERVSWLRAHLQLRRIDIANAARIQERIYRQFEDNELAGHFHELHTIASKIAPVFRKHGLPVTLRWLVGLPETGSCLAINFKAALSSKAMTLGFLAAETRIPISTIESICNGSIVTFYRLDELARALGTTAELLRSDVAVIPKERKVEPVIEPAPAPAATPAALPAVLAVPPPVVITEINKDHRGVIARRLRAKREGEDLSQAALALLIHENSDDLADDFSAGTLTTYLSKIERGNPVRREADILQACAAIFHTNPAWQCGEGDEPEAAPAEPVPALPSFHIEITDADAATRQIAHLRADIDGLKGMVEFGEAELKRQQADLIGLRGLIGETEAKVTALELAVASVVRPVQVAEPQPVVPVPETVPAILVAQPAAHEAITTAIMNGVATAPEPDEPVVVNGHGTNGHTNGHAVLAADPEAPTFSSWISNGEIDRATDTKQNQFARFVNANRFRGRAITVIDLLSELKHTLETVLLPGVKDRKKAVQRMVLREALAPNGVLMQIAPGSWSLREAAGVAD